MSNRRRVTRINPVRLVSELVEVAGETVATEIWETELCRCGLPVHFLPGQAVNTCAWCGATVTHAVG